MFKNQLNRIRIAEAPPAAKFLGQDQKLLSPVAALIEGFKGFKSDVTRKIGEYKSSNVSTDMENTRPVYELPES